MPINVQKQVEYWLTTAESDWDVARTILKAGRHLHHCLFFCHLVVEKHLKALIVKNTTGFPPKTHALLFLAEKAGVELSKEDATFLATLNEFSLESRYPDFKFRAYKAATPARTRKLFDKTEEFAQWIRKLARQ